MTPASQPSALPAPDGLAPRGRAHIPIGLVDSVDALKTFVEPDGCFSPGFATFGLYVWVYDEAAQRLYAGTMPGVATEPRLDSSGYPIPVCTWACGPLYVCTQLCQVARSTPAGPAQVVGATVTVHNTGGTEALCLRVYLALRPLGPAGGPVRELAVSAARDALLVDGHAAAIASRQASAAGVLSTDTIGELARLGDVPSAQQAASSAGACSGALRFDVIVEPHRMKRFGVVCPVRPGRRAPGHRWDGKSGWAQYDLADPDGGEGPLQADAGLRYWRSVRTGDLRAVAARYWEDMVGRARIRVPDGWGPAMAAMTAHAALAMNEGAPDAAVANYNVFNRDGIYTTSILQKMGRADLAARAIDYFLAHPFNGRAYPEADNPGQILWAMGEHWRFTRDSAWLARVLPSARQVAELIRYVRTTPRPHWVALDSLHFGDALPPGDRRELEPGRCDGHHPEYTEAFDIAGLRAAAVLEREGGHALEARNCDMLADHLITAYDERFGRDPGAGYGSCCVLWPCRLYPLERGRVVQCFASVGGQAPGDWRYFPLALAHQGLLAGSREAGWRTVQLHLAHELMQGWYALDEGGPSGVGAWNHARTTWPHGDHSVAMPHGWSIAEMLLLMRDCLVFEDGDRLVLFGGIPPAWLDDAAGIELRRMPTHFGPLTLMWSPEQGTRSAALRLCGPEPPGGFVLRLPQEMRARVRVDGSGAAVESTGDVALPMGTREARVEWPGGPGEDRRRPTRSAGS